MEIIAITLCWITFSSLAIQAGFVACFAFTLFRSKPPQVANYHPKAVIVLCLRGADPFLRQCLERLLGQDYPDFKLHVVVDSEVDPSHAILREFHSNRRLKVSVLRDPSEHCSLKCSSLVQAVRELDSSFEIVALCDGDALPHASWLAELVAPHADPRVGVTTGNRWYLPPAGSGASVVRYLWNIPATVNMVLLRIAWGGSLAIKRKAINEMGLLDLWSKALCEDTMLFGVLRQHKYRQVFVPSLFLLNRESCTFRNLSDWVPRQLLTAKLYHPSWIATVGYGVVSSLVPYTALLLIMIGVLLGEYRAVALSLCALVAFELVNLLLVVASDECVRRQLEKTTFASDRNPRSQPLRLMLWIFVSQLVSPLYFWICHRARTISWRGISYSVRGKNIFRENYSPFREPSDQTHSL